MIFGKSQAIAYASMQSGKGAAATQAATDTVDFNRDSALVFPKPVQMVERGFETARRGEKRKSCYAISKTSLILRYLDNDSQSWRLNHGDLVG